MYQEGQSGSALNSPTFSGHRPTGTGDLSVETHGIAPIREDQRYGKPSRLFTVWFAPQVNMTGVFTGALAIALGLGFWLGMLAMVIGTVLGSLVVGVSVDVGTSYRNRAAAELAHGVRWGGGASRCAAMALVDRLGRPGRAVRRRSPRRAVGHPVLERRSHRARRAGAVGFFGYEMIHRIQAVLTVVLFVTFVVFAVKLAGGHPVVTPATVQGADLVGAFVLEVTIALSLSVSWASYAADFSRYLPADSSRAKVFGFTFAGIVLAYIFVQGIGIAAGNLVSEQTAEGVRSVMGGGVLGALALLIIALASIGSGMMNDYSGSLALQTIGVRVRRPVSAVIVTVLAFALVLWLHSADTASRFQDVLLIVSYWIPAFVAVVVIDWLIRIRGRTSINPAEEPTAVRCGRGGGRVRPRLCRGDSLHAHHTVQGAGGQGMARCRHRLLRQPCCGSCYLRRLPAAACRPANLDRYSHVG